MKGVVPFSVAQVSKIPGCDIRLRYPVLGRIRNRNPNRISGTSLQKSKKWNALAGIRTLQTDIWLVVRVPVLSEQMTDVQPSVSTDGRLRTIAFFLAIRRVPSARHVVMTAGRPSGMAATANATAILK